LTAGCAAFVSGGVFLLIVGAQPKVMAWLTIVFFGIGVIAGIAQLVAPGRLVVSDGSIEVHHLGRRWSRDLARCGRFEVWQDPRSHRFLVVFDHPDDDSHRLSGVSRRISGHSASLPDTYGMAAGQLAQLLNAARDTARSK
jgi:hypothetical protein